MKPFSSHLILNLKTLLRNPGFLVPTLLFPSMLYAFFGATMAPAGIGSQMSIASFSVYAVLGVAFYQFGAGIAQDREHPFDSWQRTLPGAILPKATAQLVVAALFAIVAVSLVLIASMVFAKTQLDPPGALRLLGACLIIAIPAALMGIALGLAASGRAAIALANLIFLPLAFLGGLWIPPSRLPEVVQSISEWTLTRHMGELAWASVGNFTITNQTIGVIAAYSLVLAILVAWLIKRDHQQRFG